MKHWKFRVIASIIVLFVIVILFILMQAGQDAEENTTPDNVNTTQQ